MANKLDEHAALILERYGKCDSWAEIARQLTAQGVATTPEHVSRWFRRRKAIMAERAKDVATLGVGDAWHAVAALIAAGRVVELEEIVKSARALRYGPTADEIAEEARARANPQPARLRRSAPHVPDAVDVAGASHADDEDDTPDLEPVQPQKIGRRSPPPSPAASASPTGGHSAGAAPAGLGTERSGRPSTPAAPPAGPLKLASSGPDAVPPALDGRIGPRAPTKDDEFFANLQRDVDAKAGKGVGLLKPLKKDQK